jgi:methanogenic corrinoid protein MtbC1
VVTASPEELHTVGAQMVADVLRRDGWEVLPLGAATPAGSLLELVDNEAPDVVAISTTTAGRVPGLEEVLRGLAEVRPRPLVVVGGGMHTAAAARFVRGLGADVVTSDLRELRAVLEERFPRAA